MNYVFGPFVVTIGMPTVWIALQTVGIPIVTTTPLKITSEMVRLETPILAT